MAVKYFCDRCGNPTTYADKLTIRVSSFIVEDWDKKRLKVKDELGWEVCIPCAKALVTLLKK